MKAKRKDNNFIKVIHHKFLIIKKAVFKGTDMTKYFKGAYKILMIFTVLKSLLEKDLLVLYT